MGAPAISPSRRPQPIRKPRPAARPQPKPRARPRPKAKAKPRTPVGRTAVAVGGIADSGFVVGMTRGRAWIVVLGLLLGGIVALNVWGLGLSAGGSSTAAKIDALQRDNSVQRARAASRSSSERIEAAAASLSLAVPPPDGVHYLSGSSSDAEKAAERLANGRIAVAPPPLPVTEEPIDPAVTTETVVTAPETVPVEPVVAETTIDPETGAAIDPATGLPVVP